MEIWDIYLVRELIREAIYKYTQVKVEDDDRQLLSEEYGILAADLPDIFQDLEYLFCFPVTKVMEARDESGFTIRNLTAALVEAMTAAGYQMRYGANCNRH